MRNFASFTLGGTLQTTFAELGKVIDLLWIITEQEQQMREG